MGSTDPERRLASTARIALAVAVALGIAAPLHGQAVQGQVVDSVSGAPIGRGFVVLLNEAGAEAARTRASDDGHFAFWGISPGRYRLRSERIGYRVWESEHFAFRGDQPLSRILRIVSSPTELEALVIRGKTRCGDSRGFVEFSAVWEEARKALSVASWTAHQRGYRHLLQRYRRVRNARSGEIEHEEIWVRKGRAMQPFAGIDPDRLATGGYVVQQDGDDWYYGPDANVLLHDSFHGTHCFKAVRGRGAFEGLIGLAFGPDPAHKLADIEGALWIDAESSELRRIEYRYTNLPSRLIDRRLGGSIVFRPLESGAWIIERWEIRMPIVEAQLVTDISSQQRIDAPRPTRTELRVKSIRETGGQVIEMLDADGQVQYTSPDIAYVRGTVFDSARRDPLANELVSIVGTGYSARTDSLGHFAMRTVLDGVYSLTSGRLDSLGYDPGRATGRFAPRSTLEVALVMPDLQTAYRYLCPGTGIPEHARALVGIVRDLETGTPLQRVSVLASWRVVDDETQPGHESENRRVRTDEQGRYVLCQLPVGPAIHVEVPVTQYTMVPIDISFEDNEVVVEVRGELRTFTAPGRVWKLDVDLLPGDRGR